MHRLVRFALTILLALPAPDVLADDEADRRRGAASGWSTGAAVGAAGGAVLGVLFVAVVDGAGDSDFGGTVAPYAGGAVGCAAAGAVAIGLVGALLGAATRGGDGFPAASPAATWRLEPHAGAAVANDLDSRLYEDLHLRLYAPYRLGGWVEAGPELAWMRLGRDLESWDGRTASVGDTWLAGGVLRVGPPTPGPAPYALLGLGWYRRDTGTTGYSLGLGLRWSRLRAEVRGHYPDWLHDTGLDDSSLTVTAGWAWDP